MKFTLIKELKSDALMRPLLTGLLLFMLLFLVSDLLSKNLEIGLTLDAATATLFGNEEEFIDPLSTKALLEILHADLFFMMMLLLTLSAVYGRVGPGTRFSHTLLHSVNLFALASVLLLPLIVYTALPLLTLWLVAVWGWHLLAFGISLQSLYRLYR